MLIRRGMRELHCGRPSIYMRWKTIYVHTITNQGIYTIYSKLSVTLRMIRNSTSTIYEQYTVKALVFYVVINEKKTIYPTQCITAVKGLTRTIATREM